MHSFFGCFCREKTPIFTGLSFFLCLFGFFESNGGLSLVCGILYALFNNLFTAARLIVGIAVICIIGIIRIIRNLTGMKMLTTEQETDRYFQEVRTMLQKRKPEYEELMSILEEGEQVWMYVREKNKEIVELVILVGGKEEFMLMSFCGVIDLKKISRLAKAVNVEGMEYLGKVKK